MLKSLTCRRARLYGLLLLIFVLAAAWLWPVGWIDDDRAYAHVIQPAARWSEYMRCGGPMIQTPGDALRSAVNHWLYTNGRLSDKLLMFIQMPPLGAHFANVVCAALIVLMMWLLTAAAAVNRRVGALMLASVLCWWWLPWLSLFTQRAYLLNYVLPSCLMLGLVCTLRRQAAGWSALLAFLCAWTHEIFGAAVLAYLGLRLVLQWREGGLRRTLLTVLLTAAAGLALNVLSPGNALRAAEDPVDFSLAALYSHLTRLAAGLLPVGFACVLLLICARRRRLSAEMLAAVGAMLAASAVTVPFMTAGRFAWCALIFAIYICLYCLNRLFPRLYRGLGSGLGVLSFACLYALWGVQLARAQAEVSGAVNTAYARLAEGGSRIVELDIPAPDSLPWYIGAFVEAPQGTNQVFPINDGHAYGYGQPVVYAPRGCAGKPLSQWPRVPGNNRIYGANGLYYVPANQRKTMYLVTFGEATRATSPVERAYNLLRGSRPVPDSLVSATLQPVPGTFAEHSMHWTAPVGDINGEPAAALYLGAFRRGLSSRRIVRIDSVF